MPTVVPTASPNPPDWEIAPRPVALVTPNPTNPYSAAGTPFGTALNPLVVSGAPAGAATIVDGGDVAQGAKADAAVTDPTASATVVAVLKGILTALNTIVTILTDVHVAGTHSIKTST